MIWNDDNVDRLKSLAQQTQPPLSASDIARMMGGISRNAVIGKLMRLGVPLMMRQADGAKRRNYERRARAPKPVKRPRMSSITRVHYHHDATQLPASIPASSVDALPRVAFADLEPWHCRFPVGDPQVHDFGFCGLNRAVGTSYCPGHLQRCTGHPELRNRQSVPQVQQTKELAEA